MFEVLWYVVNGYFRIYEGESMGTKVKRYLFYCIARVGIGFPLCETEYTVKLALNGHLLFPDIVSRATTAFALTLTLFGRA